MKLEEIQPLLDRYTRHTIHLMPKGVEFVTGFLIPPYQGPTSLIVPHGVYLACSMPRKPAAGLCFVMGNELLDGACEEKVGVFKDKI